MSDHSQSNEDPCAINTPERRWAFLWAFGAIIIGVLLTCKLSEIDSYLYSKKGDVLIDYDAYRDNRTTFSSLPSESVDQRRYPMQSAE